MTKKTTSLKSQLNHELKHLTFTKHDDVIRQIRPVTWKQKITAFLNKEIELSLLPLATIIMILFIPIGIYTTITVKPATNSDQELVNIKGYVYWKGQLETVVMRDED